jgi:hypothetical protein
MSFDREFSKLYENFSSIKVTNRLFYPRSKNFNLSPQFIFAFKQEYKRLKEQGLTDKGIMQSIAKALFFHAKN